ncbi:hypothetical protein BGW38_008354, partial [Lunasporangiospora selenospora]
FKEAFNLYDRKGTGSVPVDSLGNLLRAIGQNPTEAEVQGLQTEAGSETISFDTFVKIVARPDGFKPAATEKEFLSGFKVFDKDNDGYIAVAELRYVLTNLGEKLSEQEVDELLKGIEVDKNGKVFYEDFVKMLLSS